MTKPEPYTDEEIQLALEGLPAGGIWAPDDGTTISRHVLRLLATIEAYREKVEEKDVRIAELEALRPGPSDTTPWAGIAGEEFSRAEAAEARISVLEKEREWQPIELAPKDKGPLDLWAQERERYEHERITDCRWWNGRWCHQATIHDDESPDDMAGVFNPTHFRFPPTPPENKGAPQYTMCEACGNSWLRAKDAVWVEDGSSFCPTCHPSPENKGDG